MGPFTCKSHLITVGYTRVDVRDPFTNGSKMNARTFYTNKLCSRKKDKQCTCAGLVDHSADELSSCAEERKILYTIVRKLCCLSVPLMSRPDAVLFLLIKASAGPGFSRSRNKINHLQEINKFARKKVLFLLHLTQSSTRLQAKLKFFKLAKDRGVSFETPMSTVPY